MKRTFSYRACAAVVLSLSAWTGFAQDAPQTEPHPRPRAIHYFAADAAQSAALKSVFEQRAAEVAGVDVAFAANADEFSAALHGAPDAEIAPPGSVLLGPDGAVLAKLHYKDDGANAFDEFSHTVSERTRTASIKEYNLPNGKNLAIQGYDPVAYFDGQPVAGKVNLFSYYQGVRYQFATSANRARFAEQPWSYTPTYGGWCASAMGDGGRKVEIDPTNYKVKGGRLFLFYKGFLSNARNDWDRNEKKWEPAADSNWKRIANENPLPQAERPH